MTDKEWILVKLDLKPCQNDMQNGSGAKGTLNVPNGTKAMSFTDESSRSISFFNSVIP